MLARLALVFILLPASQTLACPDSTSYSSLLLPSYPLPMASLLWTTASAPHFLQSALYARASRFSNKSGHVIPLTHPSSCENTSHVVEAQFVLNKPL